MTSQFRTGHVPDMKCARSGAGQYRIHDHDAVRCSPDFDQIERATAMLDGFDAPFRKMARDQNASCVIAAIRISDANNQHACV